MRIPNNWYENIMRANVMEELPTRKDILIRLKGFEKQFIRWAARERISYEADIDDEFEEFKKIYIDKRIYKTNSKLWKEISKTIFKRDNYTCKYCGQIGGRLEVDHVIPISKGGTNDLSNLTTSCRKCNRQKKDMSVEEFLKWREKR
jgi:hypothetical protein